MWKLRSLLFLAAVGSLCLAQKDIDSFGEKYKQHCCPEPGEFDCNVYTFAMTDIPAFSTLVDGEIKGPGVDYVFEVCRKAKKTCEVALVSFSQCWNNAGRSNALDGRWYQYCVLGDSRLRGGAYNFVQFGVGVFVAPTIIAKRVKPNTAAKLKKPDSKRTVAWMSNQNLLTKDSLKLFLKDGYKVDAGNVLAVNDIDPITAVGNIIDMVNDDKVDFGIIVPSAIPSNAPKFKVVAELSEKLHGDGNGSMTLMIRKDDACLKHWWDVSNFGMRCSPEGREFCAKLANKYGTRAEYCFPETDCTPGATTTTTTTTTTPEPTTKKPRPPKTTKEPKKVCKNNATVVNADGTISASDDCEESDSAEASAK